MKRIAVIGTIVVRMKKRLALATILLIASLMIARVSSEGNEERWLTYKQDATLEGTLLKRYHTEWLDLLGHTEEARKRAKSPAYILRLKTPISVRAGNAEDARYLEEERNVSDVYLSLLPDGAEKSVDSLVGKHVTITGKLDHANTVHHARPVMIDVSSIR